MSPGAIGCTDGARPRRGRVAVLALLLLTASATLCAADPPGQAEQAAPATDPMADQMSEQALLAARLSEVRQLLTRLDALESHLTGIAQEALDHADAAPTLEERGRYERLYTETSIRLGELRITRDALRRQLDQLEPQLLAPAPTL